MIEIRKMEAQESSAVRCFINNAMRIQYGCDAHPLPEIIFAAWDDAMPQGTIGLSLAHDRMFPLEQCYVLDKESAAARMVLADRAQVVQFGRWVAPNSRLAKMLLGRAVRYAVERGCVWGIGEAKPAVVRRFAQLGIKTILLPGQVNFAGIPK